MRTTKSEYMAHLRGPLFILGRVQSDPLASQYTPTLGARVQIFDSTNSVITLDLQNCSDFIHRTMIFYFIRF